MSQVRRFALFIAAGLTFALGACSDGSSPSSPVPSEASQSQSGDGSGSDGSGPVSLVKQVEVLRRSTPLGTDERASARVGLTGAVLVLPRAGLTLVVPPLAAPIGTLISVRAPAGDLVGYEFEPHGLNFRRPLLAIQDLTKAQASALVKRLVCVYFEGPLASVVTSNQLMPVKVLNLTAVMAIPHFSGYVIATD